MIQGELRKAEVIRITKGHENIVKDQVVVLQGKHKGLRVRRVEAWVEVDREWRVMVFLTNNLAWSPQSVASSIADGGTSRCSSSRSSRA